MKGLEDYMLPCLNKKILGVDCPGCGMQRALLCVIKGNFDEAFKLYPAIFTLILFVALVSYNYFFKNKINLKIIYILAIINIIIILSHYFYKIL